MIHRQELHVSDATLSAGRSFFTACHASRLECFLRQKICPISCTSDSGDIAQATSATRQIFFVRPHKSIHLPLLTFFLGAMGAWFDPHVLSLECDGFAR